MSIQKGFSAEEKRQVSDRDIGAEGRAIAPSLFGQKATETVLYFFKGKCKTIIRSPK